MIRVRPPIHRELHAFSPYQHTVCVDHPLRNVIISENLDVITHPEKSLSLSSTSNFLYATYQFTFDRVYDQNSSQDEVYVNSARDSVLSVLEVS